MPPGGGRLDETVPRPPLPGKDGEGAGAPPVSAHQPGRGSAVLPDYQRKKTAPRSRAGGGVEGRRARSGGCSFVGKHPENQRNSGHRVPHPVGPRLAGRDPVRPHLPAVRPLLLPDQPAPDPGVIQPGGGVSHGHRDGGGPVLRHWHHLPDHGRTRRKRHRGGSGAPGH